MQAFTIDRVAELAKEQGIGLCPQCVERYTPMYRVAVSAGGHILPVVCYYRRKILFSVVATQSLCLKIILSYALYLVSSDHMREYDFMSLLLKRYPQVEDRAWTVDIIPEPEMAELITEYAILRGDKPESEHFI